MPRKKTESIEEEKEIDIETAKKNIDKYVKEKETELAASLQERVENQVEISVTKRMKEEEKRLTRRKNWKILRRDLVILILLAGILYFGYCLYDVDYFNLSEKLFSVEKEEKNNDKEEKIESKEEETYTNEYYIEKYRYLVDNIQIEDNAILALYNKPFTANEIANEFKLKMAYKNLPLTLKTTKDNVISFKLEDLKTSLYAIFGEDVEIEYTSFSYNNYNFILYDDTYLSFDSKAYKTPLAYQISSAKEEDDQIIIEMYIGVLKDNILSNISGETILAPYDNANLLTVKEKLNKYKYTFAKEKNNYIFTSIEPIKD